MDEREQEFLRFPSESGCFGCSADNAAGLQLTFRRHEDGIVSCYTIPDRFHGAPGVAHGGIVAAIFDEISCAVVFFTRGSHVVTGELSVRYQKPCPVEKAIRFYGRITDASHRRYAIVEAHALDGTVVLARSTGKFFYADRSVSVP